MSPVALYDAILDDPLVIPDDPPTSPECRDLLANMLERDPAKRYTLVRGGKGTSAWSAACMVRKRGIFEGCQQRVKRLPLAQEMVAEHPWLSSAPERSSQAAT